MSDFMKEIEDDLRQQKLEEFWKENRAWIIGGIILAIASTAGITWYRSWSYQQNITQTASLLQIQDADDANKLTTYADASDKNHATVARLLAAGLHAKNGESARAVEIYDQIANSFGVDSALRDLAHVLSLGQRLNKDDPAKLHKEISPLTAEGSAFRFTALEMDALVYAREGKLKEAADKLEIISAAPNAPDDARTRAMTLHELYVASSNEAASKEKKDK